MSLMKRSVKLSGFVWSLLLLSAFCLTLTVYRYGVTTTDRYLFMAWNLLLAWLPVFFAWFLYKQTPKGLVWSWENFGWFALWLLFLPNAFYLVTDFIHVTETGEIGLMFDIVLIAVYSLAGFILGYTSLFLVHSRAVQRFGVKAHGLVAGSLLLSGFAIYLGRYLRWNSWDIIVNPFGLLFDLSDTVINPRVLGLSTTLLFFAFLSVVYIVFLERRQL